MNKTNIQQWMQNYINAFMNGDGEHNRNITLKAEHSKRVRREIHSLGTELRLHRRDLELAEVMGLLHDLGRFEQFARYRTFRDSRSEDHAALGVKVIKQYKLLGNYSSADRRLILTAIAHHNRAHIPDDQAPRQLRFTRLLRDADKLDIWKVVTDHYEKSAEAGNAGNGAVELGLPDTPGVSDGVYRDLMQRRVVKFSHMHNLNDFKLLQIGWVFDLNYTPSLRRVYARGYLDRIRAVLPDDPKVDEIYSSVNLFIKNALPVDGGPAGQEVRLVL